ncbi:MAG TPA: putative baseplate assembly protein [Vicinamibacterales bacterium]|nr:putative baseplate assembly protein [Vicinamibacterales bacterium]
MNRYFCASSRRRDEVRKVAFLNGIDFIEVSPTDQRTLFVHFIHPVSGLTKDNFRIVGGVRVNEVQVQALSSTVGGLVTLKADRSGDFSTYTLQLVASAAVSDTPPGFDPMLAAVSFSFKVNCPGDFDCRTDEACTEPSLPVPQISYLAKDYASFRKLIFDRLAVTMPDWRERNPADLGVTLVELLAYAGDQLSYYQDAVATEAYLGTARRRTSVRRHARLVDYAVHDGASARAWLVFETDADRGSVVAPAIPRGTAVAAPPTGTQPSLVFETLHDVSELRVSRNTIEFYTWSDARCCLPAGSTRATLAGSAALLGLRQGDVLVLEEVLGAGSGLEADADRSHRHVVRLADAPAERIDPLTATAVLDVRWHDEDALPFALCLNEFPDGRRAAVARGNTALADHGQTFGSSQAGDDLLPPSAGERPYRPVLRRSGLAHTVPYDDADSRTTSAAAAMRVDARAALPAVQLEAGGDTWRPQRDLLNSDRFASEFVVESELDARGELQAHLRFGDGVQGRAPAPGTRFTCTYRRGGGTIGNIGADALVVLQLTPLAGVKVRNPLPAQGGANPESMRDVKLNAPQAFHSPGRAVTEADYAAAAQLHPDVQRAACTRRWTGMFHTMFVTVDRRGGKPVTEAFERELRAFLERFRMAGYDLEIDGPRYVALDIAMQVCVSSGYRRSEVNRALLEAFGTTLPGDGTRGFFHPDNFTFGQPVYLSQMIARAMQVPGVQSVDVGPDGFKRFGQAPHGERDAGLVPMHRLEIARADNDPSLPENGRIGFVMMGGA